jgi:hypothetical protein
VFGNVIGRRAARQGERQESATDVRLDGDEMVDVHVRRELIVKTVQPDELRVATDP